MVLETEDVWVCGECEWEISETDKFCKNCGKVLIRNINHEKNPIDNTDEIIPNKSSWIN